MWRKYKWGVALVDTIAEDWGVYSNYQRGVSGIYALVSTGRLQVLMKLTLSSLDERNAQGWLLGHIQLKPPFW